MQVDPKAFMSSLNLTNVIFVIKLQKELNKAETTGINYFYYLCFYCSIKSI